MNSSRHLEKLNHAAKRRIAKLRRVVSPLSVPATPEADRAISWAMIEADNLWSGFLRAYYLSAAFHGRTKSNHRIKFASVAFPDSQSALKYAVRLLKDAGFRKPVVTPRDEPAWHDIGNFLKLLTTVGASNIATVRKALAYRTAFHQLLPPIRNFYAHRCEDTSRRAKGVAIRLGLSAIPNIHATEIMCSKLSRRPQNVATDWLDDMANIVDLLCS